MSDRQYKGNPYQTPVKLRTNAPRQTGEQSARYTQTTSSKPRLPALDDDEMLDDGWTVDKPHTSSIRYDRDYPYVPPRQQKQDRNNPKRTQRVRERRQLTGKLLIILGLCLFLVVIGVIGIQALGNWWQRHTDDVTYGYPRTYQTDQYVGHGDSEAHPDHFIAVNLNGTVVVLEVNPQHPQLDKSYSVTTGNDPLKPVTLTFPTVDGKQYMYVTIGDPDAAYTVAFVNTGTQFTAVQH